ncbi:phosphoribosylamine--glycine ligase [Clostridium hydrogeniformans]|uniref:phosphoribosylamine--glycine ligase n=1 Tax=Clostridium hydrogeniformans TaxID=349933 RepID=UPI000481D281|nr:phosphoribosylamine--glycine ligase [Clostridium hydrogeniformans]
MNILVIGGGGREHAIAWKLSKDPKVSKIYVSPGNGGTALEEKCENIDITSIDELIIFAKKNNIEYTVVGPEEPLTKGIVDRFRENNLKIFGPSEKGALLEGSKAYAKEFMKKYKVRTAHYETFTSLEKAMDYLKSCEYPVVIKADGLAQGKGVVICKTKEEGETTLLDFMEKDIFNGGGKTVVIEEFLQGVEASILSVTDGDIIIPFISAKDHKQIFNGNNGPNTGGMGVVAPNPYVTEEVLKDFTENIMNPTLKGINEEGLDFIGVIFFGIMITEKGVYLLEYNVRMGDPETQGVITLMESSFNDLIESALSKNLKNFTIEWSNKYSCCVMMVSKGYPLKYEKNKEISIKDSYKGKMFISGAQLIGNNLMTSGGRVLSMVTTSETLDKAIIECYKDIENISFQGSYYRTDIGKI